MDFLKSSGPSLNKPSLRVKLKVGSSPQYANVQSFYPDIVTGDIYMSQSTKTPTKAEHTRIVRFDKGGNYKDTMVLLYAGHGSSFFLYRDPSTSKVMVVISWDTTNSKREITGRKLSVIAYSPGNKAAPLRNLNVWNNWSIPFYDSQNNTLGLRSVSGNVETFVLRDWDDVQNGRDNVFAKFSINRNDTFQGVTTINSDLYRLWGSSSGPNQKPAGIERFDWNTGKLVDSLDYRGVGGEFHSNYFEPEGLVNWPGYGLTSGSRVGGNNSGRFHAIYNIGKTPVQKEEDMPLTDTDIEKITTAVKAVVKSEVAAQIKANNLSLVKAVWETDGIISAGSYASKADPEWMAKSILTKVLDNTKK